MERAERALDGVGPVPRRVAAESGAGRQDRGAARLDELLALRAQALGPGPRRERALTFGEVIDAWFESGCPNVAPSRKSRHARVKAPATIENARQLLGANVRPVLGPLWVDRTSTGRVEDLFTAMDAAGKSTSTIDRAWNYLNQACQHALRQRRIKRNPAADALLPARKPSEELHHRAGPAAAHRGHPR